MSERHDEVLHEGVAVVGLACRFPGADDADAFWRNLRDGVESIRRLDDDDLAALSVPPERSGAPGYVPAASLIDGIEDFDPGFFAMTPREAELTDPQHRLFLECCWQALEHAALDPRLRGLRTGVYGGCAPNQYAVHNLIPHPDVRRTVLPNQLAVASEKDYMASLVSYRLGFTGPAINVQTACSSALVAVHLAVQGLLTFECDVALAGAASVQVPHQAGYRWVEGGVQSRDGHCRPFDAAADGTVFGSGAGVVALKRLEDALVDSDRVWAVILGSAVNNDGAVRVSRTAPGVDGQAEVVSSALALAGVDPRSIRYVEAHGTATALGDPVEIAALEEVFRAATDDRGFCAIGSVKSNIGHADAAAGIAGLTKAVLALDHRRIPPNLHYETPNPQIDFAAGPFYVNDRLADWPPGDGPLRAGVSSFGMGGTNAHVVLQEAPPAAPSGPSRRWQLLPLSAATRSALETRAVELAAWLDDNPGAALADVAHTLRRRPAREQRCTVVARDGAGARQALRGGRAAGRAPERGSESRPRAVFLFPGQGSQYPGMGRGLYAGDGDGAGGEAVFRDTVDRCAEIAAEPLGRDLRELLFPTSKGEERATTELARTELTQPALLTVELALAELWLSWGIEPEMMLGHSVGEYAAACLAGVFSLEDAVQLVCERGRLMASLPTGSMLAVPLPAARVEEWLAGRGALAGVALAAVNGPRSTVVSGPVEPVEELAVGLAVDGVEARRLHTSHAFHSPMMEPIVERFTAAVKAKRPRPPQRPFQSCLTGAPIRDDEATDPAYWARQLRAPVRFGAAMEELLQRDSRLFLEVGPGNTLCALATRQDGWSDARIAVASLRHPRQQGEDGRFLLTALGRLWSTGVEVDWDAFAGGEERRVLALPGYPFERRRCWIDPPAGGEAAAPALAARRQDPARYFHLPTWCGSMPPASPAAGGAEAATWLLFRRAGDDGLGAALAAELRRHVGEGGRVVEALPGDGFRRHEDGSYRLRPESLREHARLLAAVAEETGAPVRHLVHLWHLGPSSDDSRDAFYPLFALARALGGEPGPERSLTVVANGLWRVAGDEPVDPAKATLLGPARTLPHEVPGCVCRVVDLPAGAGAGWAPKLAAELLADRPPADEREVAWRHGGRWVHRLEPLRLAAVETVPPRLRRRGVYLITGGLGGIGLTVSEYLAQRLEARLVLVGRTPLPPEEEWEDWLAAGGDGRAERVRRVQALRRAGAEVMVATADVGCRDEVAAVVAAARQRFGTLHGVIHGAGRPGGNLMAHTDRGDVESVLAPKVDGARVLLAAVRDAGLAGELDIFLLHSSLLGLSGGPGQAAYAAANAYLDAFAHAATAAGVPALAVDWDLWSEVGMGARSLGRPRAAAHPPGAALPAGRDHPILGRRRRATDGAGDDGTVEYRALLDPSVWFLAEHRVLGTPVLPGVAYLEMARAAVIAEASAGSAVEIRDLVFLEPLRVPEGTRREVRTTLTPLPGDGAGAPERALKVESRDAAVGVWQLHAECRVAPVDARADTATAGEPRVASALAELFAAPRRPVEAPGGGDGASPVYWGEHWRRLSSAREGGDRVVLELPEELHGELDRLPLHPSLLDLATAAGAVLHGGGAYLPAAYGRVTVHRPLTPRLLARFTRRDAAGATLRLDVDLLDEEGRILLAAEGFTLRRVAGAGDGQAEALLALGLSTEEGLEALHRLLARVTVPQVVVSPRDLSQPAPAAPRRRHATEQRPDRTARPRGDGAADAPRDRLEETLAGLWSETLGFERVGRHDDFFELGGQSLVAVQLLGRLRETLEVELPLDALFATPTVAALAERIRTLRSAVGEEDGAAEEPSLPPLLERPEAGVAPLSFQQERLWFLDQMEGGSNFYNISTAFRLRGEVPLPALRRAVAETVRRHEALRATFVVGDDGEPVQRFRPLHGSPVPMIDLSALPAGRAVAEARRLCVAGSLWVFDLERGPLVRTEIIRLGAGDHVVALTLHHIVSDGWTMGVLVDEVTALLEAYAADRPSPLPVPQLQYGDFAWSQRRWLRGELLDTELAYWRRRLADLPPLLEVAPDFPRPETKQAGGGRVPLELSAELSDALRELARRRRATLYAVLLAGFKAMVHFYSRRDDVVIGSNTSYRNWPESRGAVGFFANILPLRTDLSGDPGFGELIERVRETVAGAFNHQHVPLHKLVEELRPPRSLAYDPLVQVAFELERRRASGFTSALEAEPFDFELDTAQFDFSIWMNDVGNPLTGTCEYRRSLFHRDSAVWRCEQFRRLLELVVEDPEVRLGALVEMLETAEEGHRSLRRERRKEASSQRLRRRRGLVEAVER